MDVEITDASRHWDNFRCTVMNTHTPHGRVGEVAATARGKYGAITECRDFF